LTYSLAGVSAGVLQLAPSTAPAINYLEYGATGFIIAHEISHVVNQFVSHRHGAVSPGPRIELISFQFTDAKASTSEKERDEFTAKRQCLIEQYGRYQEPLTSEFLDGERTVIENIADNTGIKLAYRAYTELHEKFNTKRQRLIGLDYTWDQLFWLSAAQTWCGVYRKGI